MRVDPSASAFLVHVTFFFLVGDQSQRGNRSIEAPPSILESDEFKIGVGAAGGCLALLIIMAVLLLLCCCRCYHRKKTSAQEMYAYYSYS